MDSVLVTGGAGYVGSHACKALAAAGWRPVVYDDLSSGQAELVRWGPLERGDIGDADRLDAVMSRYRPRAVMHFAAARPAAACRRNIAGSLVLLEAAVRHGLEAVVFSSSCATYGRPERVPVREDSPPRPVCACGRAKAITERLLADFHYSHGLRYAALRYYRAAGADRDGEAGEDHPEPDDIVQQALLAATGLGPRLQVFGDDWPTPDGTAVRDYVHVSDVARWHVAALERLLAGSAPLVLNLGTGRGWSAAEVAAAVERVTCRLVPVTVLPPRPGDVPVLVADPSLAARALEAVSRQGDLDGMVVTAWRWLARRRLGHRL